jgi:tetratricopeptide (TPR) repeat protein
MLEESIISHEQALELRPSGHSLRGRSLLDLAGVLWAFYHYEGQDSGRLNRSIAFFREAIPLYAVEDDKHLEAVNNLAVALKTKFRRDGSSETLAEMIYLHREIIRLCPPEHDHRETYLANLASALRIRFGQEGNLDIFAEAIDLYRQALLMCPSDRTPRPSSYNNLAMALRDRFEYDNNVETITEAIELHRHALQQCPPGHPDRTFALNNLAQALVAQVKSFGGAETLAEAIDLYRQSLELRPPGHPTRATVLQCLAQALHIRFDQEHDAGALDESIVRHREALELCPAGHPNRDICLHNLAKALQAHFEHAHDAAMLAEAVALYREALQLRPSGHINHAISLSAISRCFLIPDTDSFDFDQGVQGLLEVLADNASNLRESLRDVMYSLCCVEDAYEVGVTRSIRGHPGTRVLDLHSRAIDLLPRAANFGLSHATRLQAIAGSDELSRNAAARALLLGRVPEAVEMLETGRGVFWSQTLHMRASGLDGLPGDEREELQRIFSFLQSGGDSQAVSARQRERQTETRRQLNLAAESLIKTIRARPGFERFLMPPTFASLMASLPEGFVVLINASKLRHHALLLNKAVGLTSSLELQPVQGGYTMANIRARLPRDASSYGPESASSDNRRGMRLVQKPTDTLNEVLADLWTSIVKPIIVKLDLQVRQRVCEHGRI